MNATTEHLFYLDELSDDAKARALTDYRESFCGAQTLYDTYCDAIGDAVADFERETGVTVCIGGNVYATTYSADFSDLAEFPVYTDADWTDYACDIYDAWARGGWGEWEDIPGEVNELISIRDSFNRYMWCAEDREDWGAAAQNEERARHYEGKIRAIMAARAERVCLTIDSAYDYAWELACDGQTFSDECDTYGVRFHADGRVASGPWAVGDVA